MRDKVTKEYRGSWFIPGQQEYAVPGKLVVNNETGTIVLTMISKNQLNGEPINRDPRAKRIETNILHGEIDGIEREVTLYSPSNSTIYDHGFGSSYELTYHAEFAVVGVLFNKEEDIKFDALRFKLSHLDVFFPYPALDANYDGYKFDDSVFLPEFPLEGFQVNITSFPRVWHKKNEARINAKPFIELKVSDTVHFDSFLDTMSTIQSFLFFALSEPIRITSCRWVNEKKGYTDIHYGPWIKAAKEYSKPRCNSIWRSNKFRSERIIELIQNWSNVYQTYEHSISLFRFAVKELWKSGDKTFHYNGLTNSLLNITQAIERMYKLDPDKVESFKDIKDSRVQSLDKIRQKIADSNIELSEFEQSELKSRLTLNRGEKRIDYHPLTKIIKEYCEDHTDVLDTYINKEQFDSFSSDLRKVRDDLSHAHNSEGIENQFDRGEFSRLFNKTQLLFYVILHRKVGFTDDELVRIIPELNKLLNFGINRQEEVD